MNRGNLTTVRETFPLNVLRRVEIHARSGVHAPIKGLLNRVPLNLNSLITILRTPIGSRRRRVNRLAHPTRLLFRRVPLTNMSSVNHRNATLQSTVNIINMKGMNGHRAICHLRKSNAVVTLSMPRTNYSRVFQRLIPRPRHYYSAFNAFVMNIIVKGARRPSTYPMGDLYTFAKNEGTKVNKELRFLTTRHFLVSPIGVLHNVGVRRILMTMIGVVSLTFHYPTNYLFMSKNVSRIIPNNQGARYNYGGLQFQFKQKGAFDNQELILGKTGRSTEDLRTPRTGTNRYHADRRRCTRRPRGGKFSFSPILRFIPQVSFHKYDISYLFRSIDPPTTRGNKEHESLATLQSYCPCYANPIPFLRSERRRLLHRLRGRYKGVRCT